MIIQERDRHLLRELSVMRVIDRDQVCCVAPFNSITRANCRLLALTNGGFLRRFFLGSRSGASKAVYSLSANGAKLAQVPLHGLRRPKDKQLAADFSVTHQLRINDLYCLLKFRPIGLAEVRFVRWLSFHQSVATDISLIPDGYVELATQEKNVAAFLEVDLGNESRTVWKQKSDAYLRYAMSGSFTRRLGHPQFRTLVVADSDRRLLSLRKATAEVTEKIFWFTTFDAIARSGFWASIWQRPMSAEGQTLF